MSKGRTMRTTPSRVLVLCLAVCTGPSRAAVSNTTPLRAAPLACAGAACRNEPVHARLLMPDGIHEVKVDFSPAPYVADGAIVVFPGETLVFHFSGGAGGPGAPVFEKQMAIPLPQKVLPDDDSLPGDARVEVSRDGKTGENLYFIRKGSAYLEGGTAEEHLKGEPPDTMIVSYHQPAGHPDMILQIDHNFPQALKYDAEIMHVTANGVRAPEKTSTCPVQPVLTGRESWPYPLGAIRLMNFRFIDTSKGFNCD